jgi:hypothetical protein
MLTRPAAAAAWAGPAQQHSPEYAVHAGDGTLQLFVDRPIGSYTSAPCRALFVSIDCAEPASLDLGSVHC